MKNLEKTENYKEMFRALADKLELIRVKGCSNTFPVFYGFRDDPKSTLCEILVGESRNEFSFTDWEKKVIVKIAAGEGGSLHSISKIWKAIKELEDDLCFILDCDAYFLETYYND